VLLLPVHGTDRLARFKQQLIAMLDIINEEHDITGK